MNKSKLTKEMDDMTFDSDVSLTFDDLTPKLSIADLDTPDNEFDSDEAPLSPCILSPCILDNTAINPAVLSDSEEDSAIPPQTPEKPEEPPAEKKTPNGSHEVYLVTYSRAEVVKVPGRREFGEMVAKHFNRADNIVEYWGCSAEIHRVEGIHYHLSIKLKKKRRFSEVRNLMQWN